LFTRDCGAIAHDSNLRLRSRLSEEATLTVREIHLRAVLLFTRREIIAKRVIDIAGPDALDQPGVDLHRPVDVAPVVMELTELILHARHDRRKRQAEMGNTFGHQQAGEPTVPFRDE